jgi:iron complex transport system substrate-binding protein
MKKFILAVLVILLVLCSCSSNNETYSDDEDQPRSEYPVEFGEIKIYDSPEAIVSLSPMTTELICELGFGDRLCAISDYCDSVPRNPSLPRAGWTGSPDFDVISELSPDMVISSSPFTNEDMIKLQQLDIDIIVLPRSDTLDGVFENYRSLFCILCGAVTGDALADEYCDSIRSRLDSLAESLSLYFSDETVKKYSAVLFFRLPYMVATGDTFEGSLLEMCGFENYAAEDTGWNYPLEKVPTFNPGVVFFDENISKTAVATGNLCVGTSAVNNDRLMPVRYSAFERQSPMMFDIMEDMAFFAYPGAFSAE